MRNVNVNRKKTTPLRYPRSNRNNPILHLSSTMPGVCHPLQFIPMLREDALIGQIDASVEMLETKELLLNTVTARFTAWVVPLLAMDRFKGSRDEFDRSYMGEASLDGGGVNDFVSNQALPSGGTNSVALYKAAGLHGNVGDLVNTDYCEAYNQVWNHRARKESRYLDQRTLLLKTLAPAFWNHRQFPHMVADFDQAMMQGRVALEMVQDKLLVNGLSYGSFGPGSTQYPVNTGDDPLPAEDDYRVISAVPVAVGGEGVFAEMESLGMTISLAGLEEARKLQSFAREREKYVGHTDDWIVDMLMQGLSIPDQWLKQPFQIADVTVPFTQGKRYATDSGNLDDSATSGFARASLKLRVPRINTGAVVVVLMEILPEQLWERQEDWFFHSRPKDGRPAHDFWPDAERDTLDREKVDVVYNRDVDVSHSEPNGYFAYEPMNAKLNRRRPTIGGKFHKPTVSTPTDDARQRIWAVEAVDPMLTESFFTVGAGTMHIKPFLDQVSDPFEVAAEGNCVLNGNTQFGGVLIEATGNYEAVQASAPGPDEQITKPEL